MTSRITSPLVALPGPELVIHLATIPRDGHFRDGF
jgi:hypothetical protein